MTPAAERPSIHTTSGRAAAAAALVVAATLDLGFGKHASLTVTLVFGPFVASALLPPRDTAVFGAAAIGAAVVLGWPDGTAGSAAHVVRAATVALGALLAYWLARERTRRESKLAAVTTIAEIAQLAILRPLPDTVGPLRFAGRYLSATVEARIGGDFYEAVATPCGARFVVGDVRGKGLDAIQLAALLLGEFRSRAESDAELRTLVARLDHVAAHAGGPEDFATAIVGEWSDDGLRLVRCGHPQPLRRSDGQVTELSLPGTLPLGLGADGSIATTTSLGDHLLIFSDGAIETHDEMGRDFDLAGALGAAPIDTHAALQHLLAALVDHAGGDIADDVVLVLLEAVQPSTTRDPERNIDVRDPLPGPSPCRPRPRVGR